MKARQWIQALGCAAALSLSATTALAGTVTQLDEGFEAGLPTDWFNFNYSDVENGPGWFAGSGDPSLFTAHSGTAGSYLAASVYLGDVDVDGFPVGTVGAITYTSEVSLVHETTLTFWTRTVEGSSFPDTLFYGVMINYANEYVLGEINATGAVGGYPEEWTEYSVTLPALGSGVVGNFFFDYYIADASVAGDYVGIDSVTVTSVPEPAAAAVAAIALMAAFGATARRRAS